MLAALALFLQAAPLSDLRVGEEGDVARVMIVCAARCAAAPSDGGPGSYRVTGLSDRVTVDVDGTLIETIAMRPEGGDTLLDIATVRPPRRVRMSRCAPRALCFDLDLSDAPLPPPPKLGTIARRMATAPPDAASRRSLRARLEAEAGHPLGPRACEAARRRLAEDAWALDAFRTVALCKAADGAVQEADGLLARLDAYAPDEELGRLRALIALPGGERAATRGE